jgi:DNA-binding NarL/FixJ family response regulator
MGALRVVVIEEDEILRRGLVSALEEDRRLQVWATPAPPESDGFDVAILSDQFLSEFNLGCPTVLLCSGDDDHGHDRVASADLVGVLHRDGLSAEQLVIGVRAAAAGLRIDIEPAASEEEEPLLDPRRLEVLRALASGDDTKAIAAHLQYSERTIKGLIHDIELRLGAKSRAQAVAEGMRRALI